jgi:cytochrome c-type biogenesis protein
MAVIFFGALVPMIMQDRGGLALPVIFAIGTVVPVILWALALAAGRGAASWLIRQARHTDRYVRWIAAAVLVILGLNDTILYWFV